MAYNISLKDELICTTDQPLSNFEQKFFTKFYQPILSTKASTLYLTLHSLINYGDLESKKITHQSLFKTANFKNPMEYLEARVELEALGLLDTYIQELNDTENLFYLVLKRLPTAFAFFNDLVLSNMLEKQIGKEELELLAADYLVRSHSLQSFKKISKKMDEVYTVTNQDSSEVQSWWMNTSSKLEFKNTHFDYEYFIILASAKLQLPNEVLKSTTLYNSANRLAWMFSLDAEKMVEALRLSIGNEGIDYDSFRTNCKKLVEATNLKVKKIVKTTEDGTKLVALLNKISPSTLVSNKYNTKLTPSEIEMFDKLLVTTDITLGVLNVLIIYVMETKNGEIPSYNYFLKIINTWIRKGVKTTNDALNLISTPATNNKTKKAVTPWYHEYLEQVNKEEEKKPDNNESLSDLEDFFNSKN